MNIIYILSQGSCELNQITLVTTNIKQVVKKYIDIIKDGGFESQLVTPYIQIWKDGNTEEIPFRKFHENISEEEQVIKCLNKYCY